MASFKTDNESVSKLKIARASVNEIGALVILGLGHFLTKTSTIIIMVLIVVQTVQSSTYVYRG